MRINEANIDTPTPKPYPIRGIVVPTDPKAVIALLASQARERQSPQLARAYEKHKRLERLYEQSRKSTRR